MSAPAYYYKDMTFCAKCAFVPTAMGLVIAGVGVPKDMDDAIAMMMLHQVSAGVEVETPVAVSASGTCDNCGKQYGTAPAEDVA